MSDVFISYSRKNSAFARRVIDQLTLAKKDAWVDWEGIPLTSPNWWSEIKAGIEGADSFVFIMSPDSMASVVCNLELDYALDLKKRIIPVVYQDITSRDAFASIADFSPDAAMEERLEDKDPLQIARNNWQGLSHINWMFFRATDDFEEVFARLLATVETDLPYVKAHTRTLTRALEWQRDNQRTDLLLFGAEIKAAEAWLVKAEGYVTKARSVGKVDVVNPLPETVQRDYIAASRRAQRRRRAVAGSGVLVASLAFAFAIGAAFIGITATNSANDAASREAVANAQSTLAIGSANDAATNEMVANDQRATATSQVATAVAVQGTAEGQVQQANTQVAVALVTVTHAAVVENITNAFANVMLNRSGNPAEQIAAMDALVARYPDQAIVYQARGLVYAEQSDFEHAIADYSEAIRLNPQDASAYSNRGNSRRNQHDLEGAIADYDEAIRLDPQDANTYNNRGVARSDQDDLEGAIADYDEAIRLNPQLAGAYSNRGVVRRDQGDAAGAIADFDEAIRLDPQDADAYYNRGVVRYTQNDLAGAIADFDEAIRLNPQSAEAYNNRGLVRYTQNDMAGAIADFDEAIRLDPQGTDAYNNRGVARRGLGNLEGAIADYDEAIRLNPQSADAYANRGVVRYTQNDLAGAIADFDEAIRLNPQLGGGTYFNRGLARSDQGDLAGAIADYTEAIRLDPKLVGAYMNRGLARLDQNDMAGAIADFGEIIRLDPKLADAYTNRGIVYYFNAQKSDTRHDDLEHALADWRMAQQLGTELPQIFLDAISHIEAELSGDAATSPTPHP